MMPVFSTAIPIRRLLKSWLSSRASVPATRRLGRRGLCMNLPACDLRAHQQSEVTVTDGDVLSVTQAAISPGLLVEVISLGKAVLVPRQQAKAIAYGPRDLRIVVPGITADFARCLSNDLECVDQGERQQLVIVEFLPTAARRKSYRRVR